MKKNAALGMSTASPKEPKDPLGLDDDYKAQADHSTMLSAHEIMQDDGRMEKVRAIAGKKAKSIVGFNDMVQQTAPKKAGKPKINSLADVKALGKKMREDSRK